MSTRPPLRPLAALTAALSPAALTAALSPAALTAALSPAALTAALTPAALTAARPVTALTATVILTVALAAAPVGAQDSTPNPDLSEGAEMVSEGLKKLFRGLMGELEPAGEAAEEGWNDLVDWLGDLSVYEAPERLPNGDILIRRKEPLPPGTDL